MPLDICQRANAVADPDARHYHAFGDLGGALTEKSYIAAVETIDDQSLFSGWLFLCSSGAQLTDFKQQFWSNFLMSACVMLLCASVLTRLLMRAETEAVVCSGPFSGGKQTYALLEERVPPVPELHPDEALAKLATAYFRSHSPASMQDFVWWSGLSVTEARHSVGLIGRSLTAERFGQRELFVHESCRAAETSGVPLYLLPAYDEYLIGYKDRTDVLRPEHRARAFTNYGIFYPVILYGGRIAGNWKRPARPDDSCVETSFFETDTAVDRDILEEAVNRYRAFYRAV